MKGFCTKRGTVIAIFDFVSFIFLFAVFTDYMLKFSINFLLNDFCMYLLRKFVLCRPHPYATCYCLVKIKSS